MAKHRRLRTKAWASRWKWPLLFGGGAAVLFLINARSANAAQRAPVSPVPSNPVNPGLRLTAIQSSLPIQAGTDFIPELPGVMAVSQPLVAGAQSFWETLTPGASETAGYINFPSGAQSAATLFQTRYDEYGSPYVQWAGLTYILTGPDSMGNYTATRVMA